MQTPIGVLPSQIVDALNASVQRPVFDHTVHRPGADPIDLIVDTGTLNFDFDAVIRTSGSIEFVDPDEVLIPNVPASYASPYIAELTLRRGLDISGIGPVFADLGIMRLSQLSLAETAGGVFYSASLLDRGARAQSDMPRPYVVSAGSLLEDVIPPLLAAQLPGVPYQMASTGFALAALHIDSKSHPWDEAVKLALSGGCVLYPSRTGVITLSPTATATTQEFVWQYEEGETATFLDPKRQFNPDDLPNVVVVLGTNPAAPGIRAEAWDNDPASPTYRYGLYGERTKTIEEPRLATQAQAQAMANSLIQELLGPSESVTFEAVPNPWMDVGDVTEVTRLRVGLDHTRMVVKKITMPLRGQDLMTVEAHRSVLLANDPLSSLPIIVINAGPPPVAPPANAPDLTVTAVTYAPNPAAVGDTMLFTATVHNQGTADVPPGTIIPVSFSVDGTLVSFNHTFAAGLAETASVDITANSGPSNQAFYTPTVLGGHVVIATVNDLGAIVEEDLTNNSFSLGFTVGASGSHPKPDLFVVSVSWSPLNPIVGDQVTFSAVIGNQGGASYDGGTMAPIRVDFDVDGVLVTFESSFAGTIVPGGQVTLTAEHSTTGAVTGPVQQADGQTTSAS